MRTPRLSCVRTCFVLLAVTLCGTTLRADPPAAEHPWTDAKRLAALFDEALSLVERECGATFKTRPTLHVATRADIRAVVREDIEPLAKALDLDSDGLDNLAEILSEAAMGLYQDDLHIIHIVPENMIEVPTLVSTGVGYTEAELRLLLVHEGTHAWDWERFPIESQHHGATTGDELRTLAAVAEGHAQLVAERVATQLGATEAFARLTGWITSPPADVPESTRLAVDAVVAYAAFAYVEGLNFMRAVFEARGQEGVAAALTSPPRDPDVIEHPKRWLEPGTANGPDLAAVIAVLKVLAPEPRWEISSQHIPAALLRSQAPRIPESHRATFLDGFATAQLLLGGIESESVQMIAMALAFGTPAQADHFLEAERLASVLTPERLPPGSVIEQDTTTLGAGAGGKLPGFILDRVLQVGSERVTLQMHAARFENVVVELNLVNTSWLDRPTLDAVLARVALALSDPAAATAAPALVIPSIVRKGRSLVLKVTGPDGEPVPQATVHVVLRRQIPVDGKIVEGTCDLDMPKDAKGTVWVYGAQDANGKPLPYAPAEALELPSDDAPLEVRLEEAKEIRGRVEAEDPALLAEVEVVARGIERRDNSTRKMEFVLAHAPIGPDGSFHLVGLGPNPYTLRLARDGEDASLDEVEATGGRQDVVLHLRPPSAVVVTVLGPDGHALPGAGVALKQHAHSPTGGRFHHAQARTDRRGQARLEGLDPTMGGSLEIEPPESRPFLTGHSREEWMPQAVTVTLERGWRVRGQVRDAAGKTTRARVQWRVAESYTRGFETEPDGTFEIAHLPLGPVQLRASAGDTEADLHDNEELPWTPVEQGSYADLVVVAPREMVSVLVFDGEGQPVPRAMVTIARPGRSMATSLDDGRFEFHAPEEPYDVLVTQAADRRGNPLPLGPASLTNLTQRSGTHTLRLPPGRSVRGHLRDSAGKGVANVELRAERVAPQGAGIGFPDQVHGLATTKADGSFEFLTLGDGAYDLRMQPSAELALPPATRVESGAEGVELRLPEARFFVLTVVDEGGSPVAGALVEVALVSRPSPNSERYQHLKDQRTGRDGTSRIGPVSGEQEVLLKVRGPSEASGLGSVRVNVKPPQDTRVTLERGFVVTGRVLTATGAPVAGARILAERGDTPWTATSGADGSFRITVFPRTGTRIYAVLEEDPASGKRRQTPAVFVTPEEPEATLLMPGPASPLRVHVPGGAGRVLRVEAEEGESYRSTRVLRLDADGRIEVPDLPPGSYDLWVPPTEELNTCAFRRGVDPSAGPVELALEPGRTIRARVKIPEGTKHVEVAVLGPLEQAWVTAEVEPGLHEARGLPSGTWKVHVKARAPNAWIYATVEVEAGGEVTLEPKPR